MEFDDIVALLGQISIYAGIFALVLFISLFVTTSIMRARRKASGADKTTASDGTPGTGG